MGVEPHRAPVRPRIRLPRGGVALLEDEILGLLDAGVCGTVAIVGPAGSGKTTALDHLAAVLPSNSACSLLDGPTSAELTELSRNGLCVVAGQCSTSFRSLIESYRLAEWRRDDLIEYLLALHRDKCAAVISRWRPEDLALVGGLPLLCSVICDELAGDESIGDAVAALHRFATRQIGDGRIANRARQACLRSLVLGQHELAANGPWPTDLFRVLRQVPVQLLLAADALAGMLSNRSKPKFFPGRFPRDLVIQVADKVKDDYRALEGLQRLLRTSGVNQPMAASILHFAGALSSTVVRKSFLRGTYLDGVVWREVRLIAADLRQADMTNADLRGADLTRAILDDVSLAGAKLGGAVLAQLSACRADLSNANLSMVRAKGAVFDGADFTNATLDGADLTKTSFSRANLKGANLSNANLCRATFVQATIDEANLEDARLDGATLVGLRLRDCELAGASFICADLSECDLEGVKLPDADFSHAKLSGAWLSGSVMREANFTCANLSGAGLAEIDWAGATLCNADLRGATFHMGGSRSGLVSSPIACEGSRTGFYTDEFEEQHFKAPEEIRKANLCGVDLRGALIDGVDFYLVDLRGARFDAQQETHLRRSGAILKARV